MVCFRHFVVNPVSIVYYHMYILLCLYKGVNFVTAAHINATHIILYHFKWLHHSEVKSQWRGMSTKIQGFGLMWMLLDKKHLLCVVLLFLKEKEMVCLSKNFANHFVSGAEEEELFLPVMLSQFTRSVNVSPQYAKGRHFVTAYCTKSSTVQVICRVFTFLYLMTTFCTMEILLFPSVLYRDILHQV